jgi:hypothetical protein
MDRIDQRIMRAGTRGPNPWMGLGDSWGSYWAASLAIGGLSAVFLFSAGGWWYRKRLELSGARTPDPALARRVYVFASLVWAMPALLGAIWAMATYDSPRQAQFADDPRSLIVLGFLFWSVFTSWRGATTAFALRPGAALTWFLILPTALYGVLVAGVVAMAAFGVLEAEPDVRHPRRIVRDAFQLEYPGNWHVDPTIDGYDPDHFFSIEPQFADCAVHFHIGGDFADPEGALDSYRDGIEAAFTEVTWLPPHHSWGRLQGRGARGSARFAGNSYMIALFATEHDGRVALVREVCGEDAHHRVEAGLKQIRGSFTWR